MRKMKGLKNNRVNIKAMKGHRRRMKGHNSKNEGNERAKQVPGIWAPDSEIFAGPVQAIQDRQLA